MKPLPVGTKGSYTFTVGPEDLANRREPMLASVLSTPAMILAMELASFNAIKPYFEPDETTVGAGIEVQHLAATPPDRQVRAEAEVVKVDGKRIEFAVRAFDEVEQIGSGKHLRVLTSASRFEQRLKAKMKS